MDTWDVDITGLDRNQAFQKLGLTVKLLVDSLVRHSSYKFASRFLRRGMCEITAYHLRESSREQVLTELKVGLGKVQDLIDLIENTYVGTE